MSVAMASTMKPFGARGVTFAGHPITFGNFIAEAVACGCGKREPCCRDCAANPATINARPITNISKRLRFEFWMLPMTNALPVKD
jgi:hypothetical protein